MPPEGSRHRRSLWPEPGRLGRAGLLKERPEYGKEALDTLVGKANNAAGDDIAVIMCGYEEEMKEMLLNQNPGLQRRFPLAAAFRFQDFTNDELLSILVNGAMRDSLKMPRDVADVAVAMLAKERVKPNFGNAGAANEMLNRAKQAWWPATRVRRRSRKPTSSWAPTPPRSPPWAARRRTATAAGYAMAMAMAGTTNVPAMR